MNSFVNSFVNERRTMRACNEHCVISTCLPTVLVVKGLTMLCFPSAAQYNHSEAPREVMRSAALRQA